MNIDEQTLQSERDTLKNDFDTLSQRIAQVEKDLGQMKSNLNAIFGAIQQVDKLLNLTKTGDNKMSPEKEKALNLATS
jgi:predicted ribosome quality control (RQC) complex YloA/Tae2 family protein